MHNINRKIDIPIILDLHGNKKVTIFNHRIMVTLQCNLHKELNFRTIIVMTFYIKKE